MLTTHHHVLQGDARTVDLSPAWGEEAAGSVSLVVTSPPYPLIEMWDAAFSAASPEVGAALASGDGLVAFSAMHAVLDAVWARCQTLLCPGGFLCINVGDATRTLAGRFRLYPNHARVVQGLLSVGFDLLPDILWRKPTNAPTKFMGSGMLPAGAYVTYEHEYILIARRPGTRTFRHPEEAANRRQSAYFWEERNLWFSDLWTDLRGVGQGGLGEGGGRTRSAAYPLALAHRLICMYSVYGDRVLDPFGGTGTTAVAALASGRSSLTIEQEAGLQETIQAALRTGPAVGVALATERLRSHRAFVEQRTAQGRPLHHLNGPHGVLVMTRQERELVLQVPTQLTPIPTGVTVQHEPLIG